ncbi:RNA polymerase sigma factor [uncultured Fibrobacter sp.]|uniref:RNA polymerase sigma factor n=1 Tax=uncultured Fibrobacter sp. TaxID=261512 RepID=UPI0025CFD612|nr:RNA polymerase sigma factor [uncultured Fibrobacter sp.]
MTLSLVQKVREECYRICKTKNEADDLCQMTLYRLIKNVRNIESPESLMAYAHSVLMNTYIEQKRRRSRETPFSHLMEKPGVYNADLDESVVSNYVLGVEDVNMSCINRLSSVLSPMEKRILDLTSIQGFVSREVCAALGLTPNKVAKAKTKAKEKMRAAAKISDIPPTWMS